MTRNCNVEECDEPHYARDLCIFPIGDGLREATRGPRPSPKVTRISLDKLHWMS